MATNNSNQQNMNVGLNLNGNAVASVQQLVQHMTALKQVAVDVGSALQQIDKAMKQQGNGARPTIQSLKQMNQNINMLGTTPDTMLAQFYKNQSRIVQSQNLNSLVGTRRQLTNPNTLNNLFDQHGTKMVGQAIQIRLDAAQLKNDTKAIQKAQLEMATYKAEMQKYNTSLKGLQQLKVQQDQLVSQMLSTPIGAAALRGTAQGKLERQFFSGAQEKAIQKYMASPNRIQPRTNDFSNANPDQLRNYAQENASKMEATKRIMGQLYLDGSAQSKQQLQNYGQILSALEQEKTKLQVINNLRRASLRNQDEQIKKLREEQNVTKANEQINKLMSGQLWTKTIAPERIAQMSADDLIARQVTMTKRLQQAKAVMHKADEVGNNKAKKDAQDLVVAYQKELDMIRARNRELNQAGRPNSMVSRYQEMSTGESSGALLGMQGILMRNYMLWGAFMGSIAGSYAFLRDFEKALKQTQAISQATNTQVEQLKENILDVAENSRFTAIEITEAATALAQAGFSMAEIEKTLESVTLLATATGSTLKETVDIATASLGAFQLSAGNMPKIVNQITQAMNLSKLDIQKFQLAVQYAGNAASDAGLNFEELLASVATVANAGVRSGSTLGTGFRQLLSDLIAPSTKFQNILERLGLTAADVDVRTKGLVGSLKVLKDAGFTTADAYESFEVRSVAFYTALSNNLDTYDDLSANLDNNTAAMEANEVQMDSLAAQTDRMFNQFKALAETAGAGVRDTLTDLFHVVGDLAGVLKDLTDNGVVRFVVQAGTMTVALTASILVVRGMAGAVAGLFAAVTTGAITLQSTVPIIAAISAAISVAVLGIKAFTKSNDALAVSVEASKTRLNELKDSASNLQSTILETDKRITSLESRFESLRDDPAAVAVEMANLQNKASELGITLSTDLTNSIESVRKGWEELRNELSKALVIDLSSQIAEINSLADSMLNLKVAEQAGKVNTLSEKGLENLGIEKVFDFKTLNQMSENNSIDVSERSQSVRSYRRGLGQTYNDNIYAAIADANKAGGGTGGVEAIRSLMNLVSTAPERLQNMTDEERAKAIPQMKEQYSRAQRILQRAGNQYRIRGRSFAAGSAEEKNAQQMANNLDALRSELTTRTGIVQTYASQKAQQSNLESQVGVENEMVNIRSALISGNVSDLTARSGFGNALALGQQGLNQKLAKDKYDTRHLAELMPTIKEMSKKYGVPEDLIIGHMITESGVSRNTGLTSEAGAVGLMQVMPDAAKDTGFKFSNVSSSHKANIEAGVKYLAKMKKDTGGTWEDASRAYFMGAGGLNKYKSTNGGSYAKGYNQSTTYAKTVYANMLNFQKTRGGKYEILETLDIPENTAQTLTEIESLNAIIEGAKSQIASKGDYNQLSSADKAAVDKWMNTLEAAQKLVSQKSADTNNVIRAAQAKDAAERKRLKNEKAVDNQALLDQIQLLEQQVTEAEKNMVDSGFSKASVAEYNKLYDTLRDVYQKQLSIDSNMKAWDSGTYDGDKFVMDANIKLLADMQLENAINKSDESIRTKREKGLKEAAKGFTDRIKEQNEQFLGNFKAELAEMQYNFENAVSVIGFDRKATERNLNQASGLTSLQRQRSIMDDPKYREQYTDTQRGMMDKQIELLANATAKDLMLFNETEKAVMEEQVKAINAKIADFELSRKELELEFAIKLDNSALDSTQRAAIETELKTAMASNSKELHKYKEQVFDLEDKIASLDDQIKAIDPANLPEKMGIGSIFREKANEAYRLTQTSDAMDSNITTVIDSINDSFNNLINTAISASDNVDDFFKIITGGSSESREAFKAFGYSIIQTMAKIVQDTMVKKFVSMMMSWMFPEAGNASGGNAGSGGMGILGTVVGAIAGAFGQGVVGGASFGSTASTGTAPLWSTGGTSARFMSEGGLVVGSNKNVDDVPIMGADNEYMLPSSVTETVGLGFLERLRKDPNSVVNDKIKMTPSKGGKAQIPSFTNVYVVSPDKVPSSTSNSDIIVAVEDNVARGGSLKKLIKQVANGG
mgnify:CR=1 FL=1